MLPMKIIQKFFILFIITVLLPRLSTAQNNPYSINDNVYVYYQKCYQMLRKPIVIAMTDTMFDMSGRVHDVKAQCLALYTKASHFFFAGDIPHLNSVLKKLYQFSYRTTYTQYLFGVWNLKIDYFLRNRQYDKALDELKVYRKDALNLKCDYGIASSYKLLGDVYHMRNQFELAIVEFKKALDYFITKKLIDKNYGIYSSLANTYFSVRDYDKATDCLLKYMSHIKLKYEYARTYLLLSCCYFALKNDKMAHLYADKYFEALKKYPLQQMSSFSVYMFYIHYYLSKGDYVKAYQYADSMKKEDPVLAKQYRYLVAKGAGDYPLALESYEQYVMLMASKDHAKQQALVAEYVAKFDNEHLISERNALALKNAMLKTSELRNSQRILLLDRQKKQLEINNIHLDLNNKDLILINQHQKILKQQAEAQRQIEKMRSQNIINSQERHISMLVILILSLLFIVAIFYNILRYRTVSRLRKEKQIAENARQEAIRARIEAENADKMKTYFLQNISHEIRTPLNAIVGFSTLLADPNNGLDDNTKSNFTSLVSSNTEQLTSLMNDIADLSSLESGTYKINSETFSANALCVQTVSSLQQNVKSGVELLFVEPHEDCFVTTDKVRLYQVLINLLTNACKYTDKGNIVLTYCRQDKNIEFSVTDTGRGIDKEKAKAIFNRFEKLDSLEPGMGIGLNICFHIAQLLHGQIRLDTAYNKGARFSFCIPINPFSN